MKIELLDNADSVAERAAAIIAGEARAAFAKRGRFVMAVSGGHTPWEMLRALALQDVPWQGVHVVQVDERIAPDGDPDRNLVHLRESLLEHAPLPPEHLHAMPVESSDLEGAAAQYALTLERIAGSPAVLDLAGKDVALTGVYQGRNRMTLTYPVINRSRRIIWLVTGGEKSTMFKRLRDADASIPSGRVSRDQALVLADRAAAGEEATNGKGR
jgi:6-phosphogluconolactonase